MVRCVTYNCNSIRNNSESVKELLNKSDIVCLQELMLNKTDISILSQFDANFDNIAFVKDKE